MQFGLELGVINAVFWAGVVGPLIELGVVDILFYWETGSP